MKNSESYLPQFRQRNIVEIQEPRTNGLAEQHKNPILKALFTIGAHFLSEVRGRFSRNNTLAFTKMTYSQFSAIKRESVVLIK
jgi:hypothetical protein